MTTRRNFLKTALAALGVAALPALPKVAKPEDAALHGYRYLENIPTVSGSGEHFRSNMFIERGGVRTYYASIGEAFNDVQAGDTITIRGGLMEYDD